jgi:hypothetical protein
MPNYSIYAVTKIRFKGDKEKHTARQFEMGKAIEAMTVKQVLNAIPVRIQDKSVNGALAAVALLTADVAQHVGGHAFLQPVMDDFSFDVAELACPEGRLWWGGETSFPLTTVTYPLTKSSFHQKPEKP